MLLKKLLENVDIVEIYGKTNVNIEDVVTDSKCVTKNSLFICLKGENYNGADFIDTAKRYGATAVVCEERTETDLIEIVVKDARKSLGIIASNFYSHPEKNLKIIGVIGTNGKTTTSHLIFDILNKSGIKTGVIGTIGTYYNGKFIEPTLTTPDPLVLFKTLSEMNENGIKVVVMEVSAHAIYYKKTEGITFEIAVFTNFSQDHLDFFKDIETYKNVKKSFFNKENCKNILSNSDDVLGLELVLEKGAISYGIKNPADVFAINVKEKTDGTEFTINLFDYVSQIRLQLIGYFNVYNALACATVCALLGLKTEDICDKLNELKCIEGRMEKIYENGYCVYVDYAHTPDGLEKALLSLKRICERNLICIFGCGGNRDSKKRSLMGEISGKIADFTIVTSDNPRFEEPMDIIFEIEKGLLKNTKKYVLIQDRKEGIKYAVNMAKEGDVILIAGKGAEKYQDVLGTKTIFSDKEAVKDVLRGKRI